MKELIQKNDLPKNTSKEIISFPCMMLKTTDFCLSSVVLYVLCVNHKDHQKLVFALEIAARTQYYRHCR